MSRDYKATSQRKSKMKGGGSFKSFLKGLFLGLLVALIVYLDAHTALDLPEIAFESDKVENPNLVVAKPKLPTPTFNFYDTLPEMEVVISDSESAGKAEKNKEDKAKSQYILQVASFRKASDADEMKAKLALLGFEAEIEPRRFASGVVWHRVKIGPYLSTRTLDRDKRRLQDQGIDALTVKQSG